MDRRRFVLVAGAALSATRALMAQQKTARIGVFVTSSFFAARFEAFRQGMRELGYVEGSNLAYEVRDTQGVIDRTHALAGELARANVDLIFAASAEAVLAVMKVTATTPIVFGSVQDPVASGIVDSLARPGRNATGLSAIAPDLGRKRLELLREIRPGLARVGYLLSPLGKGSDVGMREARAAAQALGMKLQSMEVRRADDLGRVFAAALAEPAQGFITSPDPLVNQRGQQIVAFARDHRLPAVYAAPEHVELGGLMTYAPNYHDLWRRAATFANRILKGANPADLPVEQPTKIDLIVSVKAARAIGLDIPKTILFRADRVIE